ncbi:unnamed protein product, partial [Meganyctiphanes norvegica]
MLDMESVFILINLLLKMFKKIFVILLFFHLVNSCNRQVVAKGIKKGKSVKTVMQRVNNAYNSASQALDDYGQKHCDSLDYYNWCKHFFTPNYYRRWMSFLPDSRRLADLNIPGTHNSCAIHGGLLVECQSLTIPQQLNAGIRFLDIRLRSFHGGLVVHHGQFYQHMNFDHVLSDCTNFLWENPSETILMRIKKECTSVSPCEGDWDALVQRHIDKYASFFRNGYPVRSNRALAWLSLGELRGTITTFSTMIWHYGAVLNDINFADVQDQYSTCGRTKWIAVEDHLVRHKFRPHPRNFMSINFLSAFCVPFVPPYRNAKIVNERILRDWIELRDNDQLGTILMDFPGQTIIGKIIDSNQNQ